MANVLGAPMREGRRFALVRTGTVLTVSVKVWRAVPSLLVAVNVSG